MIETRTAEPLLTALVSTWASERYLRGCLDDLLAQTLGDRLEILVVDACSPEREGEIVRSYQQRHSNIRYVRTQVREASSASFNRGTALARGRYLTTANTDDRHHPEFAARMVAVLEQHPEFGLCYADSLITRTDNETWQHNTATTRFLWPDFTPLTALSCCLFGAQPVWRRAAHDVVGPWDDSHRHANDQDMFLRIARGFGAVHVRDLLGLFLRRPDSVAGSANRDATLRDVLAVFKKHRTTWPFEQLFPALAHDDAPMARAAAWWELGNLAALGPYTDAELALQCWQRAVEQPLSGDDARQVRAAFANNSGCILACAGLGDRAARAWSLSGPSEAALVNMARSEAARCRGVLPGLPELRLVEVDHAVVRSSRRTRGLVTAGGGAARWSTWVEQVPWQVFEGPNGVPIAAEPAAV